MIIKRPKDNRHDAIVNAAHGLLGNMLLLMGATPMQLGRCPPAGYIVLFLYLNGHFIPRAHLLKLGNPVVYPLLWADVLEFV